MPEPMIAIQFPAMPGARVVARSGRSAALITPPVALPQRDNRRGVVFMLLAVSLFSLGDAGVKWLSADYPVLQIVFLRSVAALLPLGCYLWFVSGVRALYTRYPAKHLLRSLLGIGFVGCLFYAYAHLPLANVVAIHFAAPLFITALSMPLLGERVGAWRWSAVLVGFVGVLIMVRPRGEDFNSAAWVAVLGTLFYALAVIVVRRISRTETSGAIVFYNLMMAICLSGLATAFHWVPPTPLDWGFFLLIGSLGGMAQICITNAFRFGELSVVAPLEYLTILMATGLGYLIWGDLPDGWVWLGTAVVVASGLVILHRETRRPVSP